MFTSTDLLCHSQNNKTITILSMFFVWLLKPLMSVSSECSRHLSLSLLLRSTRFVDLYPSNYFWPLLFSSDMWPLAFREARPSSAMQSLLTGLHLCVASHALPANLSLCLMRRCEKGSFLRAVYSGTSLVLN